MTNVELTESIPNLENIHIECTMGSWNKVQYGEWNLSCSLGNQIAESQFHYILIAPLVWEPWFSLLSALHRWQLTTASVIERIWFFSDSDSWTLVLDYIHINWCAWGLISLRPYWVGISRCKQPSQVREAATYSVPESSSWHQVASVGTAASLWCRGTSQWQSSMPCNSDQAGTTEATGGGSTDWQPHCTHCSELFEQW